MANYLVTGAAGFVGSSLASALLEKGHRVVGLDNLSTGNRENVPEGVLFIEEDCLAVSPQTAELRNEQFEAIFHLAGRDDEGFGPAGPLRDLRTNAESTLRLLDFAESSGCRRFIYGSSAAVYGPQPDAPVAETALPGPISCSGVSKLAAEGYLALYQKRGIRYTALRLFSVYGSARGRDLAHCGLPAALMEMALRDKHIEVNGSPNRCRDFVHISDVTRAFLACLERPQSEGQILNIGGTGKVMVGDLVDRIAALCREPVTVEYHGCSGPEDFGVHADISMAAKYLGYDPEVGLDQGLKAICDRYGGES